MKSKKLTSILIAFVALLWGIIFYRVYLTMDEKKEVITTTTTRKIAFFHAVNHINDSVSLCLNYRDPFSLVNKEIEEEKEVVLSNKAPILMQAVPKQKVNWEGIFYTGYINNVNSKQKLAIILIQGKEFMFAEGQILNGLQLLTYARDSIKVRYQNQSKFIKLR